MKVYIYWLFIVLRASVCIRILKISKKLNCQQYILAELLLMTQSRRIIQWFFYSPALRKPYIYTEIHQNTDMALLNIERSSANWDCLYITSSSKNWQTRVQLIRIADISKWHFHISNTIWSMRDKIVII